MEEYNSYLNKIGEYGTVTEVRHPIVTATGLPHAKINEIVIFENGQIGEIFFTSKDDVKMLVFSKDPLRVGMSLVRTEIYLKISVGEELLGSVIDPLGRVISPSPNYKKSEESRETDAEIKSISERSRIKLPFRTGITIVDFLIPLGKGQKELVIGDRKTGKSSIFVPIVKTQVQNNCIIIYSLIGKNKTDAKRIIEKYQKEGLGQKMIFVVSTSNDSPSLIYLTPYTAMTIAEYFRDRGQDVMIVLDDLSAHANYYREIILVSGGFPGRDSYPGDIFYIHAKLMERAGNFIHSSGKDVSITCFPVVETTEGDLTGFIQTNIMSMTDGHIFFDSNAYYNGRRPAIDVGLSVTRVGRQTQPSLKQEINREISTFLANYERLQNYSHFGTELSQKVKDTLRKGDLLYELFNQHYATIIPEDVQLILFGLIWLNLIDEQKDSDLEQVRTALLEQYKNENVRRLFAQLLKATTLYQLLTNISKSEQELIGLWKTKKVSQSS